MLAQGHDELLQRQRRQFKLLAGQLFRFFVMADSPHFLRFGATMWSTARAVVLRDSTFDDLDPRVNDYSKEQAWGPLSSCESD